MDFIYKRVQEFHNDFVALEGALPNQIKNPDDSVGLFVYDPGE